MRSQGFHVPVLQRFERICNGSMPPLPERQRASEAGTRRVLSFPPSGCYASHRVPDPAEKRSNASSRPLHADQRPTNAAKTVLGNFAFQAPHFGLGPPLSGGLTQKSSAGIRFQSPHEKSVTTYSELRNSPVTYRRVSRSVPLLIGHGA